MNRIPPRKTDYHYGTNECGLLAWWRPCYRAGENKGTFSPGRGYTSYFKKPIKVCGTRFYHGCPSECSIKEEDYRLAQKPDPDWEAAWTAIQAMTPVNRKRYTAALVRELIISTSKWRSIVEERES